MKLTSPIYKLKIQAKQLKNDESIGMVAALNLVAQREGYSSWSLLADKAKAYMPKTADEILDYLYAGDMVLLAARPHLGKTMLALEVLLKANLQNKLCWFFSLEYTEAETIARFKKMDIGFEPSNSLVKIDCSDQISANSIIQETTEVLTENSIIVVDYLQLLDQKRNTPPLQQQIEELKDYAHKMKCIIIFITQIDRKFEQSERQRPRLDDIRLPNPLDLASFNKTIFI